jgi:hypothetical protein
MLTVLVWLSISFPNAPAVAPLQQERGSVELAPEKLEGLIEALAKEIEETYVFPDVATKIGAKLREQLYSGAYEGVSIETISARLTTDLRSVNNDRHLNVAPIEPRRAEAVPDPAQRAREEQAEARRGNYGFQRVEILDGNVGYLDLRGFLPTAIAHDTAAGAMAFLANVDALIIDLRHNGGGEPSMIDFLCSHFFAERTHLNDFEWRGREGLEPHWTTTDVPRTRLLDVPIYVLTSRGTFSAAEEFTYDLRNLQRATVVGETTGGGAHPGDTHDVAGLVRVFIPQGRAINPITKTNWEGVGVEPHVKVPAEQALDTAKREAAKAIAERRKTGT